MFKNELEIAQLIDHTQLKANALEKDLKQLCDEAKTYQFKMVAINQVWSEYCAKYLKDTKIHVGAAIAFPLGQTTIEAKAFETLNAIENGADEIDYVLNIGKLLEKDYLYIEKEMQRIVEICRKHDVVSKVIFETCYLANDDIIAASKIAKKVKPDFVKTSTGFGSGGATLEHVKLMKAHVGDEVLVKAAGGIRDLDTLIAMVKSGASRIGTSSGIKIIEQYRSLNK